MTNQATEILTELRRRGVLATAVGGDICLKPKRALDDALRARIREAKPAILEALRNRPATCGLDCYEVAPGVWIHQPCAGCTTLKAGAEEPQRYVQVECWHCHGEKTCGCIACWR